MRKAAPALRRGVESPVDAMLDVELRDRDTQTESKLDAAGLQEEIAKLLKHTTFEPEARYWLDTGSPELNAVFGSRNKGIPYGKILELAGEEHGGKTTLTEIVAAIAQRDGAAIGRMDLENSRDRLWDIKMGLDPDQVVDIWPKLVQPVKEKAAGFGKKKKERTFSTMPRLQSAQELFAEAEAGMHLLAKRGYKKQFWFLDSVANIETEMVVEAGVEHRNMRTMLDRAAFLSQTLPGWAGLAANYNATIFLINQLRDKQGLVFGDPSYSPGGRALRHSCAIRARVRRKGNGKVLKDGRTIGMHGVITNFKNKAGEGSEHGLKCAFRIVWTRTPAKVTFSAVEEEE